MGEERALFRRARLFISPHGALLANIFFMPWFGQVLEIRPRQFDNGVYAYVAHICGVRYHLLYGNGTKETHISIDHTVVIEAVKRIVKVYLPPKQESEVELLAKELKATKGAIGSKEDTVLAMKAVPEIKNSPKKILNRVEIVEDTTNVEKQPIAPAPKIPKQDDPAPTPLRN